MSVKANYIKFPREFTTEPLSSLLSPYAKILYVILSDRLELSEKNREFQDDDGTPFVYFTGEDLAVVLGCSKRTVDRTLKELENIGLIYRYRQYACKANKIYVRNVKKVMLKVSENAKECSVKLSQQSRQNVATVASNCRNSSVKLSQQSRQNDAQSISKSTNQKNQSQKTSQMYQASTPPQQEQPEQSESDFDYEYEWEREQQEQEEQRKRQRKADDKKLLKSHFEAAFDKITDENDSDLLLAVLYDIYAKNRHIYTINGKEISRDDIFNKIFRLHDMQVARAIEVLQEVRAKKHIENEFIYLLTILYNC